MNIRWLAAGALVCCLLTTSQALATRPTPPTHHRKGLTIIDRARVSPGYVVFAGNDGDIYVIGVEGQVARRLRPPAGQRYAFARPLDNGRILVRLHDSSTGARSIVEIDRAGRPVWQFAQPDGVTFHHDHSRLANGNTLILCSREIDRPEISRAPLQDDCVLEVRSDGTVAWDWQTADRFGDFEFSPRMTRMIRRQGGDWAHANAASAIPRNGHADPRFRAGNIIVSYRFINAVAIIDRQTGRIVWRTDGTTIGQHDPHMIPRGLPGAGNILIFDNGLGSGYDSGSSTGWRSFSRVIEIDPVDRSIGYEYRASASGLPQFTFNSFILSSAQRLPNGNTLIDEGAYGRIFEVTADGEIVWEYISRAMGPFRDVQANVVYRATKVPLEWLNG